MKTIRRFLAPIFLTLAVLSYAACASDEPTLPAAPGAPASATGVTVQIISTDLSVGRNRVAFALLNESGGVVSTPNVRVSATAPGTDGTPSDETRATFRKWPLGDLGIYTAQLDFSTAGPWRLSVSIMGWGGVDGNGDGILEVKAKSATPAIGSSAPASRNKTIDDVESLEQLTTANPPDPELYRFTIADALALGKPLVVVFATPAYCKTATCGPQLGEIGTLKERFESQAAFIHVEVFDNPHLIQGDLERAVPVPSTEEWGLLTEPWTFVVDSNGDVAAKFEAFTTAQEIEEALLPMLN